MGTLIICMVVMWGGMIWLVARNEERIEKLEFVIEQLLRRAEEEEERPPWAS